jgi:hypothetical protein
MSSQANVFSTPDGAVGQLNGLFKEVYADKLKELIPDGVKLLNMIKFSQRSDELGNKYNQPVVLGLEHGITFAASTDDAFNLLPAISGVIKNAEVRGSPAVLRSILGYNAASRSQSSAGAFMEATKFLVSNMLRSMAKKIEIEMLYGQVGYATVAAGGGTTQLTITTAEWAPGIWAGSENMPIEVRSTGGTLRGSAQVSAANMDTRVVTTDSAIPGVQNGDVIWHKGAYGNEFVGIHKILTTTSGSLFNIDVTSYNLFQGNQYSASSGALSFSKLNLATSRGVEKGLEGKLSAFVNPRAWANMLSDQAALRRYDGSYSKKKLENGSEALAFYAQNGEIEIIPSIYVKEGYCYMLSMEDWQRVGSQDITFNRPGQGDRFFRDLDNAAGYELRCFTDQAVFCSAPGRQIIITGIVNSTS